MKKKEEEPGIGEEKFKYRRSKKGKGKRKGRNVWKREGKFRYIRKGNHV